MLAADFRVQRWKERGLVNSVRTVTFFAAKTQVNQRRPRTAITLSSWTKCACVLLVNSCVCVFIPSCYFVRFFSYVIYSLIHSFLFKLFFIYLSISFFLITNIFTYDFLKVLSIIYFCLIFVYLCTYYAFCFYSCFFFSFFFSSDTLRISAVRGVHPAGRARLWLQETLTLNIICKHVNPALHSVAAQTLVWADPSLRYTSRWWGR